MRNPFHPNSTDLPSLADLQNADAYQEDRAADRENDEAAARAAHAYGSTFGEIQYDQLPAWALHDLDAG